MLENVRSGSKSPSSLFFIGMSGSSAYTHLSLTKILYTIISVALPYEGTFGHQTNGFGCVLMVFIENTKFRLGSLMDPRHSPSGDALSCRGDICPGWELGLCLWALFCL